MTMSSYASYLESSSRGGGFGLTAGRVVSRDELTDALYRRRATKFDRSLDMHICNLSSQAKTPAIS